jgi:hypothetical protein
MERRRPTARFALALLTLAAACLMPLESRADIHHWRDAAGVMHFTNERPPRGVRVIESIRELPYDAEADRERLADERRLMLEYRRLDVEEQMARLGCDGYTGWMRW